MSREKRAESFLFEPTAFLNDHAVLVMSLSEVGAYSILLFSAWGMPEPGVLPSDDRTLAILSRAGSEWPAVKDAIARAFDTTSRPGFWVSKRMVATKARQDEFVTEQSRLGRLGAAKRWGGNGVPIGPPMGSPSRAYGPSGSGSGSGSEEEKRRVKGIVPAARERFTKPTLAELQTHLLERRSRVDPMAFLAHYESNGWRVGKAPMKNWKAAVVTWETNDMNGGLPAPAPSASPAAKRLAVNPADPRAAALVRNLALEKSVP